MQQEVAARRNSGQERVMMLNLEIMLFALRNTTNGCITETR